MHGLIQIISAYVLHSFPILSLPNGKHIITYGKRSFNYYGAHVWKRIPVEIKEVENKYNIQETCPDI